MHSWLERPSSSKRDIYFSDAALCSAHGRRFRSGYAGSAIKPERAVFAAGSVLSCLLHIDCDRGAEIWPIGDVAAIA